MTALRSKLQLFLAGALLLLGGLLACGSSSGASSGAPSPASPVAAFTWSPTSPSVQQAVGFSDTSTGNPSSWSWDFGDGGTSTTQNPSHAFAAAGTYTVSLTASNAAGTSAPAKQALTVSAGSAPAGAGFTLSPSIASLGETVTLTDTSTNSPAFWNWNFGDGFTGTSTSAAQNPTHAYSTIGTYTITLTAGNAGGSSTVAHDVTITATGSRPTAAFLFAPTIPTVTQPVAFRDTSTIGGTAWAWSFGDGSTSTQASPSHAFAKAGTYTVTLTVTYPTGSRTVNHPVSVIAANAGAAFDGSVILGSPTDTSIKANVFSPDQGGWVYLAYGTSSGTYDAQTPATILQAATPLELTLSGLKGDTPYFYRLFFRATGQSPFSEGPECTFHTARTAGSGFTFCIQGDSHPERVNTQFNGDLYTLTLATAAADKPDFYLTIGDDFSIDQLDPTTLDNAQVVERYVIQRPYLGIIGRSAPVFLVNGNHEQAARYLLDGTPNNPAVWAQNARSTHYSQPAPDAFYTGNPEDVPFVGLLRNYYAWTWGDALFVVIDPYWESPTCVDNPFYGGSKRTNLWEVTHGEAQYQWLKRTLEQSKAKYKFLFAHHVMGTGRGGIEEASQYEWGGHNADGTTWAFPANRPSWPSTIHQLMVANRVTIFFQGHDHIWVHQQLDGVTYQALSEPADPTYTLWNADAYSSTAPGADKQSNTGYTRVTISPTAGVKVEYVRTCLPADQASGKSTSGVASSYTIP